MKYGDTTSGGAAVLTSWRRGSVALGISRAPRVLALGGVLEAVLEPFGAAPDTNVGLHRVAAQV